MKNDFDNLINFWNNCFILNDELKESEKKDVNPNDYESLSPSPKILDAIRFISKSNNLLDYGCGSGWASIIAAKYGCKNITAVDMAPNAAKRVDFYADLFNTKGIISSTIDFNWLDNQNELYDGIICFNVLDVVPDDVIDNILTGFYKSLKKNGNIILSFNYYINPNELNVKGYDIKENKYIYIDNILRLTSLSDEEWTNKLSKYFEVIKLEHFSWPGEEKETRRLFYLIKK